MAIVLTSAGKAIVTNRIKGAGTEPAYVGWGTGAGTTSVGDTTLFTEQYSTSNDGTHNTRPAGISSQQTTTVTNDTYQVIATLTCASGTGAIAVTNAGNFDSNGQAANLTTAPSGGNLFVKGDFSTINLAIGDSIQFTIKCQFT
jgi:hypothetical protein